MIDYTKIEQLIRDNNAQELATLMQQHNLYIEDGKIKASKEVSTAVEEYWDKRQLVRKILLNSAYGALLNEHCRFYDKRLGQSVTLTGRQIVKHMSAYINEVVTGKYDFYGDLS